MNHKKSRQAVRARLGLSFIGLITLPCVARADSPAPDPAGIITIQLENDALSIPATDRLYTAGQRIGYVTPTGDLPVFLSQFGRQIFGGGTQRLEFDLGQVIFTPTNTQAYDPNPNDQPYAAQLALHISLIQDSMTTRSIAQISAGVVGPDALGQSVQNGFHELIGNTPNRGWRYQLHNEPTLDFYGARIWRDNVARFGDGDIGVQILPQISGQVGNTEIYGQAGAIIRFGQGLDSDFGPAIIQPGTNGTDAYTPTRPLVWYVFAGAIGRLVAHDIFIQGNDFQSSRHVPLTPLQGDFEIGGAVMFRGVRLSATEVLTTPEFHGAAPAFQYGSVAISTRF
ncbi:MAG: lipid A deacylase LpxR family protein [Acidocella sp.]|nr:lipid A deacylase LpxR family protein [Acidocella sp.]